MYLRHLTLGDFRSYASVDVPLQRGVGTLIGRNGQGKTNLVEAIGYLATLGSHRVSTDAPLVRAGAESATIRAAVMTGDRETQVDLEIVPGRANRAKLGRANVTRPRDILGTVRTVLFAPEDLALVKGDPGARRRFLDELLVARQPRWAGVRADYDKILKHRSALLKSAQPLLGKRARGRGRRPSDDPAELENALSTLAVWNSHLAEVGSQLLYARLRLARDLGPHLEATYADLSDSQIKATMTYRASIRDAMAARLAEGEVPPAEELREELLASMEEVRQAEVERGVCLVGPHRDDLELRLGELPAKGYASHGESWSIALGLKLASYELLRTDLGDDPILILDDVFAELDTGRRERLAARIADGEQILITAAVEEDIPAGLTGARYAVTLGTVTASEGT